MFSQRWVISRDPSPCIVAEAVDEYVERAVENADIENYTLADVVTDITKNESKWDEYIEEILKVDYNDLTPDLSKKYNLPKGKTFYWRVKAIDSKEAESSYTKASRFFTERDAEVNQVPNQPTIITPANNIVISKSSVSIQWQATDPDNDVILYDMYFGTDPEALPLIIESASQNNYLATLQPKTKYYWKIVVKDHKGGVTIGNIWSFSTN